MLTPKKIIIGLIKIYQMILRPYLGCHCRFTPSCSDYSIQAVEKHGAVKGTYLSAKRLYRCNPWQPGGIDEVPEKQ
ncbi:MAG: membrane protein insertion efficiency factor YidD [Pseudomonadota bacterium]|nr:membrane protein insertion efficiency factor YidD [Pseudomonadota bacterium]